MGLADVSPKWRTGRLREPKCAANSTRAGGARDLAAPPAAAAADPPARRVDGRGAAPAPGRLGAVRAHTAGIPEGARRVGDDDARAHRAALERPPDAARCRDAEREPQLLRPLRLAITDRRHAVNPTADLRLSLSCDQRRPSPRGAATCGAVAGRAGATSRQA